MGNTVPIPSVCAMEGGDMATAAVTKHKAFAEKFNG